MRSLSEWSRLNRVTCLVAFDSVARVQSRYIPVSWHPDSFYLLFPSFSFASFARAALFFVLFLPASLFILSPHWSTNRKDRVHATKLSRLANYVPVSFIAFLLFPSIFYCKLLVSGLKYPVTSESGLWMNDVLRGHGVTIPSVLYKGFSRNHPNCWSRANVSLFPARDISPIILKAPSEERRAKSSAFSREFDAEIFAATSLARGIWRFVSRWDYDN